jgi:predicted Zn-dependent peptidase
MAMLLSAAGGMEANSDLADYYVGALHELHDFGHFLNWEDRIEEVTPHDVQELARRLFVEGEVLEFVNEPTLSYENLAAGMLSIAALPLVVGGLWWWRRR